MQLTTGMKAHVTARTTRRLSMVTLAGLLLSTVVGCTQPARPGDDLSRARARGVALLEAHQDREFLEEFMVPYQRQHLFGNMSDEDKVKHFRAKAAEKLLGRLKAAEKLVPKLNDSRTEATWPLDPEMRWVRVDGKWRIVD